MNLKMVRSIIIVTRFGFTRFKLNAVAISIKTQVLQIAGYFAEIDQIMLAGLRKAMHLDDWFYVKGDRHV